MNLLKSFRERTGILLQDMATMIHIDTGNLSKMEHGKLQLSVHVLLAYHMILKIPIERLCKYLYPEIARQCLQGSLSLKDQLISIPKTPKIKHRQHLMDTVIDRLETLATRYEN